MRWFSTRNDLKNVLFSTLASISAAPTASLALLTSAFALLLPLFLLRWWSSPQARYAWLWSFISGAVDANLKGAKQAVFGNGGIGLSGSIVEIGPGTGETLPYFLPPSRTGLSLTLVEPNTHMHAALRKRAEQAGLAPGQVQLLAASAEHLSLPAASADYVVCCLVLCSVADPSRVLEEVVRVLKPNGSFLWLEHVHARAGVCRTVQNALTASGLWPWLCGGCRLTSDPRHLITGHAAWKRTEEHEFRAGNGKGWDLLAGHAWGIAVKA